MVITPHNVVKLTVRPANENAGELLVLPQLVEEIELEIPNVFAADNPLMKEARSLCRGSFGRLEVALGAFNYFPNRRLRSAFGKRRQLFLHNLEIPRQHNHQAE
jgi:hypothetical protein